MLVCDFCGKTNKDVDRMLQKDNGRLAICEVCINDAHKALHPNKKAMSKEVTEVEEVSDHLLQNE